MSETKKSTTLYLRRDILARCKELNINMSDLVNRILAIVLEEPGTHDEEISLAILRVVRKDIDMAMQKNTTERDQLKIRADQIDAKIERQVAIVKEITRSDAIAQLIRQLNVQIRTLDYDISRIEIECMAILEDLKTLGLPISREWLEKQIERMKRIGPL